MPKPLTTDAVRARLDARLGRVTARRARRGLPAPQVLVRRDGFEYEFGERAMPFHAASVGKLATTALVMQEVESGRLDLETPVGALLPAAELRGLFAVNHPSTSATVATVAQLLAHTSGVADYFEGRTAGGPRLVELAVREPDHRWEPAELLDFSREHQRPIGRPGERFAYSDTGFVLLGRILEELTGSTFTTLLRARIFEPAEMADSVLWLREPGPERIAPLHIAGDEVSAFASISCDWAGGGIVSTVDDLDRLVRGLAGGALVAPASWQRMTQPRARFHRGIRYGVGAMELRFGEFMPLVGSLPRPLGHIGVTGVHAFIHGDTTVVLNFHDTREMSPSFQAHIAIAQALARLS